MATGASASAAAGRELPGRVRVPAADQPHLLTYVPSVSRPGDQRNRGWTGAVGRVNLIVEEHVERFGLVAESTLVYACGSPRRGHTVNTRFFPGVCDFFWPVSLRPLTRVLCSQTGWEGVRVTQVSLPVVSRARARLRRRAGCCRLCGSGRVTERPSGRYLIRRVAGPAT